MRLPSIGLRIGLGIVVVCAMLAAPQARAQTATEGALGTPLVAADEKIPEVADALARFTKMDFPGALELLRKAAVKYPDRMPPPQVVMYIWFAQARQGSAAMTSLETAIVEDPEDPQAYIIHGQIEFQNGQVTAAGLLYEKAQELIQTFTKSPGRKEAMLPSIYAGLASVAEYRATLSRDNKERATKEWVAAEGYLRSWLELDPKNALAMQRLARAMFSQKTKDKVNAAYEMLKSAKAADDSVLTPAATMALLYQSEDDYDRAKEFMSYALKVAPEDLRTRLTAVQWCLDTSVKDPNQLEEARVHAVKAVQLDEESLNAKILRGGVALFQKEYETAERFFTSAHVQDPSSFAASNNLALALCEQDEVKKRRALAFAEGNARQYNEGNYAAEAASTYGWVLYRNGRVADADSVLSRLVGTARVSPDTLYYAAQVAWEQRRPEDAKQLLQRALQSGQPFSMRPEAVRLEEELRKPGGP